MYTGFVRLPNGGVQLLHPPVGEVDAWTRNHKVMTKKKRETRETRNEEKRLTWQRLRGMETIMWVHTVGTNGNRGTKADKHT